jgi:hypothetical protein
MKWVALAAALAVGACASHLQRNEMAIPLGSTENTRDIISHTDVARHHHRFVERSNYKIRMSHNLSALAFAGQPGVYLSTITVGELTGGIVKRD